ncbi:uncharacterized protein [Dermacentor andersoni]|uniref:uncharacterized protein n=1 Tax=Dermacentor andersoni TaxID=34620 RepID=UPI0024166529|nr:uncharacterized protein LOC129380547 isoform X2 [Dermacentor andersoni]
MQGAHAPPLVGRHHPGASVVRRAPRLGRPLRDDALSRSSRASSPASRQHCCFIPLVKVLSYHLCIRCMPHGRRSEVPRQHCKYPSLWIVFRALEKKMMHIFVWMTTRTLRTGDTFYPVQEVSRKCSTKTQLRHKR